MTRNQIATVLAVGSRAEMDRNTAIVLAPNHTPLDALLNDSFHSGLLPYAACRNKSDKLNLCPSDILNLLSGTCDEG